MPPPHNRKMARVNAALRREIGALITTWLRDPRISKLTTVSRVTTARDLGKSTVYIVIHGSGEERAETLAALTSARVALRHVLKNKIRMRNIPQLIFKLDDDEEKGAGVIAILDRVAAELHDRPNVAPDGAPDAEPVSGPAAGSSSGSDSGPVANSESNS